MKKERENTKSLIPLREMIVFPSTFSAFLIGRNTSIAALDYALHKDKTIFLATQINPAIDVPKPKDIFTVGVEARIVQTVEASGGNIKVVVEGIRKARILEYLRFYPFYEVVIKSFPDVSYKSEEFDTNYNILIKLFKDFISTTANSKTIDSVIPAVSSGDPIKIIDIISSQIPVPIYEKQNLLETMNPVERVIRLIYLLRNELRARKSSTKASRYKKVRGFPPPPPKREFDEEEEKDLNEIEEIRQRIYSTDMPEKVRDRALKELDKLELMPPMSAEATVSRNYIDWLLSMPWNKKSREKKDIKRARKILEEDHYGLEKVKKRILEFLAVKKLTPKSKSPILCFVGPPGVGKSSLGKSIARAMGRKFIRLSLGGIRDEAEIKGHRRTYIGAYPGQIAQQIKRSGVKNPVFLLDEVDKMSSDFRGDPAAALLEVLDPEQNKEFVDRYLDIEFDLTDVFFITTANHLQPIPSALLDRMEVIEIPGYTELEKLNIAKQYLIKKELIQNGIKNKNIEISDDAILEIIRSYTRESGVRNLQREIANILRKVALKVVEEGKDTFVKITAENIEEFLGPKKFHLTKKEERDEIGVVIGLAWTESGGDLLTFEVRLVPGKGELVLTGRLGEVMKESAQTAFSYVKNKLLKLNFDFSTFKEYDYHLHVPEGAVPKEGPSAGITIATALISLILNIPVKSTIAMTGEVTLRGKVLPIGGLKEKLIAAHREKIEGVIIPFENKGDLSEIPPEVKESIRIYPVKTMDEVLSLSLIENIDKYIFNKQIPSSFAKREN